jgi:streptogramin lyase
MKILFLISLSLLIGFVSQDVFAETEMTGWLRITDSYSVEPGPHPYLVFFQSDNQETPYMLNPQTMSSTVIDWAGERVRVTVADDDNLPLASSLNQNQQFLDITSIGLIDKPLQSSIENIPPQQVVVNARSATLLSMYNDVSTTPEESPGTGPGQFKSPYGVAVDSSGNIYTIEFNGSRVQKFDSNGNFLLKFGSQGTGDGQFLFPTGIAVDSSGNIYVVESNGNRVQKFDSNGVFLLKFGSSGSGNGQFSFPFGIAVDSSDNIYVADTSNHRIQKFNSTGGHLQNIGSFGIGDGQFNGPRGVALDTSNNIYVIQSANDRIQKFDSGGGFLLKHVGSGSGEGQFLDPHGIAVDNSDNVFVADAGNHRIQKFDDSLAFVSMWGWGVQDGTAALQTCTSGCQIGLAGSGIGQLDSPEGIAAGSIYVGDANNDRIKKFNSTGGFESSLGFDGSLVHDQAYYDEIFYNSTGSLKNYYITSSYGNYIWSGEVSGWENVTGNQAFYATNPPNFDDMITDAIAAHEDNVDFCQPDPVENLILIFNGPISVLTNSAFGSLGTWTNVPAQTVDWPTLDGCRITISVTWEPDNGGFFCCGQTLDRGIGVTAHELGHNQEFVHTPPPPGLWSMGVGDPYHDVNSVMSNNQDREGPSALIMGQRNDVGWVTAGNKITILNGTSSTVTLDFSNEPQGGVNHQMAIVPLPDGTSYIIEGHTEGLFNDTPQDRTGAIIYKKIPGGNQYDYLLDSFDKNAEYSLVATNGTVSEDDFDKAILEVGQSYEDVTNSVTITTQSTNSTSVTVFVSNNGSAEADADSDGVPDGSDNCPNDANPLQKDLDQDSLGDKCDILNQMLQSITVTTNHELIGDMEIAGGVLVTLDGNSNINLPPGSKLVINFPGGFLIIVGSSFTIS